MEAGFPTHLRSRLFGARHATPACKSRSGISTTLSEKRRHS